MTKWITIAKHEFAYNVRRKEFLFMTFGLPFIMFALIGIPVLLGASSITPEDITVGYVDKTGTFEGNFTRYAGEELAKNDLLDGKITHLFVIPADYRSTGKIDIFSTKKLSMSTTAVEGEIKIFLLDNLLKGDNKELVERVKNPIKSEYFILNEKGESGKDDNISGLLISLAFAFFFMLSIFTSSNFLLQGVVEEKENRVMEILLSSVSHRDLLTGKIFGLGAVGLTQVFIWQVMGIAVLSSGPVALLLKGISISIPLLIFASGYFILGYLVFACILAGVGAIATTSREGQQIAGIFTMIGAMPLIISQLILSKPDSAISMIFSYFPLTSPITMIMRISTGNVQYYEVVLSLIILTVSILVIIELSVKVFRASLLMYGKKPTISELIKYVR
ncbi:MAG: ABC transporter permease [Candidatus Methanoperedens sp.]|nr:ABC transporter permease [Candidatus Methanoperedens sp.]